MLKLELMTEVDIKRVAEVDKKQREKVMNQIEKAKEKMFEEEVEALYRKEFIDTVLDKTWFNAYYTKIMRNNECCTSEIKIALALYH